MLGPIFLYFTVDCYQPLGSTVVLIWSAWVICNIFSTLYKDWLLWLLPLASILAKIIYCHERYARQERRSRLLVVLIMAIFGPVALFGAGTYFRLKYPFKVKILSPSLFEIQRRPSTSKAKRRLMILADPQIIGQCPGKLARRWMTDSFEIDDILVSTAPSIQLPYITTHIDIIAAFGSRVAELPLYSSVSNRHFAVCPILGRKILLPRTTTVLLPGCGDTVTNWTLRKWYSSTQVLKVLQGSGEMIGTECKKLFALIEQND